MSKKAEKSRTSREMPTTLLDAWEKSVAANPDKNAVCDSQGKVYTYAQADLMGGRLAAWLKKAGIKKGDVVACQMPGWAEFLPIYVACMKLGAVITPITPNLRKHELSHILDVCGSTALFVPRSYRSFTYCQLASELEEMSAKIRAVVAVDKYNEGSSLVTYRQIVTDETIEPYIPRETEKPFPDDPGAIIFTSGSEGLAKGVMLTNRNILYAERSFAEFFDITDEDRMFMPAPIAHATGFHHGVTMPFIRGATSILQDRFTADAAIELIQKYKPTVTMATTAFLHDIVLAMRENPRDISSLRFFLCGGSPPNLARVREAGQFGLTVLNVYGATESVPHMGTKPTATPEQIEKQALFPMPGMRVAVVDRNGNEVPDGVEGEEISYSDAVFHGYIGMPDATARALKNGWYHSGDLCRKEKDGSYTITGRLKDIIVRGGENISCLEVESILLDHQLVGEAAVVSMPDARLQERICAFVVLSNPDASLTLEEVCEHFASRHVAKVKYPERLEIIKDMPRNNNGKIDKNSLRKTASQMTVQEISACRK